MPRHKCLAQIEATLREYNTRLVSNLFNQNDIFIATEQIETGRGKKKAKSVIAAFCPFCGKKQKRS